MYDLRLLKKARLQTPTWHENMKMSAKQRWPGDFWWDFEHKKHSFIIMTDFVLMHLFSKSMACANIVKILEQWFDVQKELPISNITSITRIICLIPTRTCGPLAHKVVLLCMDQCLVIIPSKWCKLCIKLNIKPNIDIIVQKGWTL